MALIIKQPRDVLMFRSGVARTARSLSDAVDQLQAQNKELRAQMQHEREQHKISMAQAATEKATLARKLCEAELEIARRDQRDAFAACQSPSAAVH
jgi:predicted phage tail protein